MDKIQKKELMDLVTFGTLKNVQDSFKQYKLSIQDKSFFDYELLKVAVNRNEQSIINYLLQFGCRVTNPTRINYDETPLHIAIKLNNVNTIKILLKNGASLHDKNTNGETPIYTGFKQGNGNAVNEVLNFFYLYNDKFKKRKILVKFKVLDPKNKDDILHFHIACILNNVNVVRVYLECGFDINIPISIDSKKFFGLNPLYYAATEQQIEMFRCLVRHNANPRIKKVDGKTALHIFYNTSQFKNLSQKAFNFRNDTLFINNSVDNNDIFYFYLCCMKNCPEIVEIFIEGGVDINSTVSLDCQFHPGFTALHFAVLYCCDKVVKLLLQNGANSNAIDNEGSTPLHLACGSFYTHLTAVKSIVKMLLDYNASVTAVDINGCTPLHKIFKTTGNREVKILNMLIAKIPRDVNYINNEGLSHFHIICTRNNTGLVRDFLKSGVKVDHCVTASQHIYSIYSGYTPLHFAVLYNQKNIVKLLLKWKAQVNIQTKNMKSTPLHLACEWSYQKLETVYNENKCAILNNKPTDWTLHRTNQLGIIKLLLQHGANIEAKDLQGATALLQTCSINSENFSIIFLTDDWSLVQEILLNEICYRTKIILEMLLSKNANINARTKKRKSILHLIHENDFLQNAEELIEFLIDKGADVNADDENGFTPLYNAIITKNRYLIHTLLKYKANVNALVNNTTLLEISINNYVKNSYIDRIIVRTLLKNGSEVNIRKSNGIMILHEAIKNKNLFILEMLLYYGADINMEDSDGNSSAYFLLNNWSHKKIQTVWQNNITHASLFEVVYIHVQKLLALGLYVNKKVLSICTKLHKYHNIARKNYVDSYNLDPYYNRCILELEAMKHVTLDNCTLYSILTKDINELLKFLKKSTLADSKDVNFGEIFPLYGYLLNLQLTKARIKDEVRLKRELLESAKPSLSSLIGFNLPHFCYDLILKDLTVKDIVNLITAASMKRSHKRKRNCDLDDVRLPPKLRKKE